MKILLQENSMSPEQSYKVLFINPPSEHIVRMETSEDIIEEMGYYPPLGLLYIATHLKEKSRFPVEVKLVDCVAEKVGYDGLRRMITDWAPDMCAITTFTPTIVDASLTCALIKKIDPKIRTVLGGHHVDSYPYESLSIPDVDFVLKGEGDQTLTALVENLIENKDLDSIKGLGYVKEGKAVVDPAFSFVPDLDELPIPDRGLIRNDLYTCALGAKKKVATIISSRGCPYQCTFCYCPTKNYRVRSVGSILSEVKEIMEKGITEIFFFDDLFNVSPERVMAVSQGILDSGFRISWSFRGRINSVTDEMLALAKKSGCERIHYGIETSSDDRLRRINKKITVEMIKHTVRMTRKHKISTIGNFMIGLPGETRDEIFETFDFMKKLALDYVEIAVLMPYPHTELYKDGLAKGVIKSDFWKEFAMDPMGYYKDFRPQVWTEMLSQDDLFKLINVGYRQFYMRPSYMIKSLVRTRSVKELKSKAHGAWILLNEIIRG